MICIVNSIFPHTESLSQLLHICFNHHVVNFEGKMKQFYFVPEYGQLVIEIWVRCWIRGLTRMELVHSSNCSRNAELHFKYLFKTYCLEKNNIIERLTLQTKHSFVWNSVITQWIWVIWENVQDIFQKKQPIFVVEISINTRKGFKVCIWYHITILLRNELVNAFKI